MTSLDKQLFYEYYWLAEGILFNVCRDAKNSDRGDLHRAIYSPYCANFSTHYADSGPKGLFTLISDIYADLLGISMLEKSNMVDGINIRVIDC